MLGNGANNGRGGSSVLVGGDAANSKCERRADGTVGKEDGDEEAGEGGEDDKDEGEDVEEEEEKKKKMKKKRKTKTKENKNTHTHTSVATLAEAWAQDPSLPWLLFI